MPRSGPSRSSSATVNCSERIPCRPRRSTSTASSRRPWCSWDAGSRKSRHLATALGEDLPLISGDRIELQQVLLNLIANAIDAMEHVEPRSRQIQVGSWHVDGAVKVTVSDNWRGATRCGRQADVQAVLHDESHRHGCRAGDQPVDYRGAWRSALGRTEHRPRRDLLFHCATGSRPLTKDSGAASLTA